MHKNVSKAFTMVELIFVIIIIGILSAIAIPKFAETTKTAHIAKAQSTLVSVMSAIATERQKRILKGDFANAITSLGSGSDAFSVFNADKDGIQNEVLRVPVANCSSGETGCWSRSSTSYVYKFVDSADGDAKFKLENNRLVCDNDASDCAKLLK